MLLVPYSFGPLNLSRGFYKNYHLVKPHTEEYQEYNELFEIIDIGTCRRIKVLKYYRILPEVQIPL